MKMQSHCQHNLYICHCSPSSQDPSPIHPLTSTHQTTTLHRFPAKRNSTVKVLASDTGNGGNELVKHQYTVSHSSVAVMTSPTLNNGAPAPAASHQIIDHKEPPESPSTTSSCSSLPTTTVMTMQHHNGLNNGGSSRYSQHLGML